MKIRHETPATSSHFGCNSLMNSQMRKKHVQKRGPVSCLILSISVYFFIRIAATAARVSTYARRVFYSSSPDSSATSGDTGRGSTRGMAAGLTPAPRSLAATDSCRGSMA